MVSGDVAVSTDRAVDDRTAAWHVACFACCKCREPLVHLVHFWTAGRLYCGRHHAETVRPRCFACDEASSFLSFFKQISRIIPEIGINLATRTDWFHSLPPWTSCVNV